LFFVLFYFVVVVFFCASKGNYVGVTSKYFTRDKMASESRLREDRQQLPASSTNVCGDSDEPADRESTEAPVADAGHSGPIRQHHVKAAGGCRFEEEQEITEEDWLEREEDRLWPRMILKLEGIDHQVVPDCDQQLQWLGLSIGKNAIRHM
jgi:hypothetical protein